MNCFRTFSSTIIRLRNWNELSIIVDRKLRFQARNVPLLDPEEIPHIVEEFLREHRNIAKTASHPHMLAWRIGPISDSKSTEKSGKDAKKAAKGPSKKAPSATDALSNASEPTHSVVHQGFKDNGEKGAGSRMLEILARNNVSNTLLICTRWYGGSPLGSLRFRHIANASFDSLRRAAR